MYNYINNLWKHKYNILLIVFKKKKTREETCTVAGYFCNKRNKFKILILSILVIYKYKFNNQSINDNKLFIDYVNYTL